MADTITATRKAPATLERPGARAINEIGARMTTTDHTSPWPDNGPVNWDQFRDAADRDLNRSRAEAAVAESRMHPQLAEVVHYYRDKVRAVTPRSYFPSRDGAPLAPCPVCGQRTAVISHGDVGAGPTVEIYCDNENCPAREIQITITRGTMDTNVAWPVAPVASDARSNVQAITSRQRVSDDKKRRPNQQVWRKMWRTRHGGTLICNLCGASEHQAQIQIDHIVELRDGGEDADWNTQPLCVDCHRRKTSSRARVARSRAA